MVAGARRRRCSRSCSCALWLRARARPGDPELREQLRAARNEIKLLKGDLIHARRTHAAELQKLNKELETLPRRPRARLSSSRGGTHRVHARYERCATHLEAPPHMDFGEAGTLARRRGRR